MYSTRTTKIYSPTVHDINRLPLAELGTRYNQLLEDKKLSLAKEKKEYLEYLKEKIDASFSGEESYEGSYEEYNLDEKVTAKFRGRSGLGSDLTDLIDDFAKKYAVPKNAEWFFGQMLAKFAAMPLEKNDNGYSAKALYTKHIKPSMFNTGMWLVCRHPTRSSFLDKQTSAASRDYCSLVPLIMSAFKRFHNIKYSEWDPTEVFGITEENLYKAMTAEVPDVTKEEVLEIRELALTPKTGKTAGITRSPVSTYSLFMPADSPLTPLPTLARIMVCQTWCAHPANRTKYMILNPSNWDEMPEELIDGSDPVSKQSVFDDIIPPWL